MRKVTLTLSEKIKVLANQIKELVLPRYPPGLLLENVQSAYLWQFGYALKPPIYDCSNITELLTKLPSVKVCITTNYQVSVLHYTSHLTNKRFRSKNLSRGTGQAYQ